MEEEYEDDGWMGRHRAGEDDVSSSIEIIEVKPSKTSNIFTYVYRVTEWMKLWKIRKKFWTNAWLNFVHRTILWNQEFLHN